MSVEKLDMGARPPASDPLRALAAYLPRPAHGISDSERDHGRPSRACYADKRPIFFSVR